MEYSSRRLMGGLGVGALVIVSLWAAGKINRSNDRPDDYEEPAKNISSESKLELAFAGAVRLEKITPNPDSFRLEKVLVMDETGAACYTFRSQNGLGGANVGHAVLTADKAQFKSSEMPGFTSLWNGECAKGLGTDETDGIKAVLSGI